MKGNKGLLDKNRFKYMEELTENELKNLTISEAVKMTEDLISSGLFEELNAYSLADTPQLCLKLMLEKRKNELKRSI